MARINVRGYASYLYQFRHSAMFIFLSLVAAAINYAYYPLMSRLLPMEEFGASQALITILSQAGSLFAGLSLMTIYLVQRADPKKIAELINITQKTIVAILFAAMLLFLVFQQAIAEFLHLSQPLSLLIVVLDLLLSVPFVITFGYLLAKKRFIAASLMQISVVTIKLVAGGFLAYELHVTGALLGIGVGYPLGMGLFWLVCKLKKRASWEHSVIRSYRIPSANELRLIRPYLLPITAILIVSACVVVFPTLDVLAARHFLDATTSSLYAAASTLSTVLLFACLPVVNLLIPLLNPNSLASSMPQIKKALAFISLAAFISLTAFIVLPSFLLSLFGPSYTGLANVLWVFGLNMFFACLLITALQVLVLYRPRITMAISLVALAALGAAFQFFHTSPNSIITAVVSVYASIVLTVILPVLALYYRQERSNA